MKRKQKKPNKLFNIVGQAVMYIIFSASCFAILVAGFLANTIY